MKTVSKGKKYPYHHQGAMFIPKGERINSGGVETRKRSRWAGCHQCCWSRRPGIESPALHNIFVKLAGTPVLRTGQEVGNMAYRISGTIEPKNQKVGRNMEIWVSEVPLIEIAMNYSSWGTLRRPLIRTATWKCRPLEQLFISLFTQWNKLADMKCFKI